MEYQVDGITYELVDVIYDDDFIYGVYENSMTGEKVIKIESCRY